MEKYLSQPIWVAVRFDPTMAVFCCKGCGARLAPESTGLCSCAPSALPEGHGWTQIDDENVEAQEVSKEGTGDSYEYWYRPS